MRQALILTSDQSIDVGLIGEPSWAQEGASGKYKSVGVMMEILPPITVSNGIIHVIDRVMLPMVS